MTYVKIWKTKAGKRVVAILYENDYGTVVLSWDATNILIVTGWSYSEYATLPEGIYNL